MNDSSSARAGATSSGWYAPAYQGWWSDPVNCGEFGLGASQGSWPRDPSVLVARTDEIIQ